MKCRIRLGGLGILLSLYGQPAFPAERIVLERSYPPEIFDYCLNRTSHPERAARCMRREARLKRELDASLRRHIGNSDYRRELYDVCVDTHYLEGTREVSRCASRLLRELYRVQKAVNEIRREVKKELDQLRLLGICFEGYDGSPTSLQTYRSRKILHCVRTKARYYRLHGRF